MDITTAHAAAQLLYSHRCNGSALAALPEAMRPATLAEGHLIQAQLPAVAGQTVAGWKIAATSEAGQRHIHVSGPLAGRILSGFVVEASSEVSLQGIRMRVVEPEFAFCFGQALAPRAKTYTVDEVLDAVASLHPAFEVPDSRYTVFTQAGEAQLLADDACCGRFAFAPAAAEGWRDLDLGAHTVRGSVSRPDGDLRYTRDGIGRAALGDPRTALAWLVNDLSSRGIAVEPGQFVSTGTCMIPLEIEAGDIAHADFGALGSVRLRFVA